MKYVYHLNDTYLSQLGNTFESYRRKITIGKYKEATLQSVNCFKQMHLKA